MATRIAAFMPDIIDRVYTYNAPGIERGTARRSKETPRIYRFELQHEDVHKLGDAKNGAIFRIEGFNEGGAIKLHSQPMFLFGPPKFNWNAHGTGHLGPNILTKEMTHILHDGFLAGVGRAKYFTESRRPFSGVGHVGKYVPETLLRTILAVLVGIGGGLFRLVSRGLTSFARGSTSFLGRRRD